MFKRYIGDRAFYKTVMSVAVPIMIQNLITCFVSMLDNIMVGQVGTVQMSGVSIVNQILFVFNLCVFGCVAGAGIFTAQFAGSMDYEGVRQTFRFKLISCMLLVLLGAGVLLLFGEGLVRLYLQGEGDPGDAGRILGYGREYLSVMLWGLVPFALSNVYSSTLRETGETVVPMVAGVTAVAVNLFFNYMLIFGHFGAPALGTRGAAVATVISRFVELALVAGWAHLHTERVPFAKGLYRTLRVPRDLTGRIIRKGMPLLVNEALWSSGMAVLSQCYSVRGLEVMAAFNICMTLWDVMNVACMAMGSAIGIIIGQKLGACRPTEEVRDDDRKLIAFSVAINLLLALLMMPLAVAFPLLYRTTDAIRSLAAGLIRVMALVLPFAAFTNGAYFTLRSGGKTIITFLFDSCFVWVVCVPLAFCLSRFTALPILPLYFVCQATEAVKCLLGGYMLHRGDWAQSIISPTQG